MTESDISTNEKQGALEAVLNSALFLQLERLRDFLSYVVQEEMAGRTDAIRSKTIAHDVYGRSTNEGSDPENVVRVDARRLRQTLNHYYDTAGAFDSVRIYVDTGGYRPRFERNASATKLPTTGKRPSIGLPILTFAVGSAVGVAISLLVSAASDDRPSTSSAVGPDLRKALERQAIREKSPASLQAVNLAEQGRAMIFPIFDRPRQHLVTEVFRRVIDLDPDYFGGYAGAAQTLGTLAILTPPGSAKDELLVTTDQMSREAIRLEPTRAWAQSARAWAKFANRNYDDAQRFSHRAAELDPSDGNILDFHGTVALFSGDFSEAISAAEKGRKLEGSNTRFANRNIFAAASFHLGNFEHSLDAFEAAANFGDPISAPSFAFQVAALHALGHTDAARRKLDELKAAWPDVDLRTMMHGIYQYPEHVEQVLGHLAELGWSQ